MPATAGSKYQAIRLQHIANTPPNCDPQRDNENFTTYYTRITAQGLPPDIGVDESDSDYLIRLATYVVNPPVESISAIYAATAGSEISPAATSSFALRAGVANALTTAATYTITASKAVNATTANGLPIGTYAITSSWATNAVNSAPSSTASYLTGQQAVLGGTTADNLTITNTSGKCIDARSSTTGYGIYAQGLLAEAVAATQTGVPSGAINRGALSATRAMNNLNGQTVNVAVFTVLDQYNLSNTPLISATTVGTEVFQVDYTGSISVSGSKGYTGTVMFAGPVTMAFQGGILTSVA